MRLTGVAVLLFAVGCGAAPAEVEPTLSCRELAITFCDAACGCRAKAQDGCAWRGPDGTVQSVPDPATCRAVVIRLYGCDSQSEPPSDCGAELATGYCADGAELVVPDRCNPGVVSAES